MRICEREGCDNPGREYYVVAGVVHANLPSGAVQVSTQRGGNGFITLCPNHALTDLGVAFP